jgi:hypothetical protein
LHEVHAIIWNVSLGIINTKEEVGHLGSSNEGDRFVMVGYKNLDEYKPKGHNEEKSSTPCVQRETNSKPHGNTCILHLYFFHFFIVSFVFSLYFVY